MGVQWKYDAFTGSKKLKKHSHESKFELTGMVPSLPEAAAQAGPILGGIGKGAAIGGGFMGGAEIVKGVSKQAGSTLAAFPQGAGFGLGYGVGVRIGYEGLYPNIKAGNYPGVSQSVLGLIPGFQMGKEGFWSAGEREKRVGKASKAASFPFGSQTLLGRDDPFHETKSGLVTSIGPSSPFPKGAGQVSGKENIVFSNAESYWFKKLRSPGSGGVRLKEQANNWIKRNSSYSRYTRWVTRNY